jgi:cobalamin-independent methionine synthase catalytic subunit
VSQAVPDRVWPPGAVTAIGSMPGTDPVQAAQLVFGEVPNLPFLPELPARGPGAAMIGRTAALLVDLPVEIVSTGWRLTARPGRDLRRACDLLAWDLDAVEQAAAGYAGALKVQAGGPWTMAASLELPNGHRAVSDLGAARELAGSLAEGLRQHLADLRQRVPHAQLVLQLDEPSMGAVLAGHVPTPSGFGTVRAVEPALVRDALSDVLAVAAAGARAVHDCSSTPAVSLLREAGADAISLDMDVLDAGLLDAVGEFVDGGGSLWAGVIPSVDAPVNSADAYRRLRRLWSELGFGDSAAQMASALVPTPSCGLAGATPDYARLAVSVLRELGQRLVDAQD